VGQLGQGLDVGGAAVSEWVSATEPEIQRGISPVAYCDTFPFNVWPEPDRSYETLAWWAPTIGQLTARAAAELSRLGVSVDGAIVAERDDNVSQKSPFLVPRNSFQSSPPQSIRHAKDVQ
jgi:hypothetical protein